MLWITPAGRPADVQQGRLPYLAQSQIARIGLNPYKVGPAPGWASTTSFTLSVPSPWRETLAPLRAAVPWIGRGISALTGENIVAAVLCHRLVVPHRSRHDRLGHTTIGAPLRCGRSHRTVARRANPLLLMHLVAGIHNEALMLGTDADRDRDRPAGIDNRNPLAPLPLRWPQFPRRLVTPPLGWFSGTVLITLSSQVKLPGLLALGFVTDGPGPPVGRHR